MITELRQAFNANYSEAKYREFLACLEAGCGFPIPFRNSETPCFFSTELIDRMAVYGKELIAQLMNDPAYLAKAEETVPPLYRVPMLHEEERRPLFVQVDFGLDQQGEPKLVEIQGFPSLYAYQPFLAHCYRDAYNLDPALKTYIGDIDEASYREMLHSAIVGEHNPENVVLLEVEPQKQKTLCDFVLTEKMLGVRSVCLTQLEKRGNRLYYRDAEKGGKEIQIERIYNRVIVEELERKGITPPFDLREPLDVTWAGHPNWYFMISKFSLPYLNNHPSVPRTWFLNWFKPPYGEALPTDMNNDNDYNNYVLKPLYSFAGQGVKVGPTAEEVEKAINSAHAADMILQERIDFAATIDTPYGPTKTELRIMYLWREEPIPVTVLVRMGRGKMMGVDHNRDLLWVGASAAFIA